MKTVPYHQKNPHMRQLAIISDNISDNVDLIGTQILHHQESNQHYVSMVGDLFFNSRLTLGSTMDSKNKIIFGFVRERPSSYITRLEALDIFRREQI